MISPDGVVYDSLFNLNFFTQCLCHWHLLDNLAKDKKAGWVAGKALLVLFLHKTQTHIAPRQNQENVRAVSHLENQFWKTCKWSKRLIHTFSGHVQRTVKEAAMKLTRVVRHVLRRVQPDRRSTIRRFACRNITESINSGLVQVDINLLAHETSGRCKDGYVRNLSLTLYLTYKWNLQLAF